MIRRDPTEQAGGGDSLISAEENRRIFDRIARRYDRMNRLLSLGLDRRWRRAAVGELELRPGGAYLDVGCGTADLPVEILRECPSARVTGVDVSEGMQAVAASKLARAGIAEAVTLTRADALELPFDPGRFDGVISAFCLRNVTDRPRALREMLRVLAPGRVAVVLDLTLPPNPLGRLVHRLHIRLIVPLAAAIIARDRAAYRYLVHSVEAFPSPTALAAMMAEAGFTDVRHRPLLGGTATILAGRKPTGTSGGAGG